MASIKIRNYDFPVFDMKQASARKALQLKNTILQNLKKLGIREEQVMIREESLVIRKSPASVSCYLDGQHLYFSYTSLRYIENLSLVSQIIEAEVQAILQGKKTKEECIAEFMEERDIELRRKQARETLGLPTDTFDVDLINKAYKDLSKVHHPDLGGNLELFQEINIAHKTLKRELC